MYNIYIYIYIRNRERERERKRERESADICTQQIKMLRKMCCI